MIQINCTSARGRKEERFLMVKRHIMKFPSQRTVLEQLQKCTWACSHKRSCFCLFGKEEARSSMEVWCCGEMSVPWLQTRTHTNTGKTTSLVVSGSTSCYPPSWPQQTWQSMLRHMAGTVPGTALELESPVVQPISHSRGPALKFLHSSLSTALYACIVMYRPFILYNRSKRHTT
jgi:hypothetical protein